MPLKKCQTCRRRKRAHLFHRNRKAKDGINARCKNCDKKARVAFHINRKEEVVARRRAAFLKAKYGLTVEQYDDILKRQGVKCAICGIPPEQNKGPAAKDGSQRLAVDHDHETGEVRGLLCNNCNRALGMFKDSISVLTAAIRYLKNKRK